MEFENCKGKLKIILTILITLFCISNAEAAPTLLNPTSWSVGQKVTLGGQSFTVNSISISSQTMGITNSAGKATTYYYNATGGGSASGGNAWGSSGGKPVQTVWLDPYGNVSMNQTVVSNVANPATGQRVVTYQRSNPNNNYVTQFAQTRDVGANGKPKGNWYTLSTSVVKSGNIISQNAKKKNANGTYSIGNGWVRPVKPPTNLTAKDLFSPARIKAMGATTNITPNTKVSLNGGDVYWNGVKNKAGKNVSMYNPWWWSGGSASSQNGATVYYGGTTPTLGKITSKQSGAWVNGKVTYIASSPITGGSKITTYTPHKINGYNHNSYSQSRFDPGTGSLTTRSGGYGSTAAQRQFKRTSLLPAGATLVGTKYLAGNQASTTTTGTVYLYSNGTAISTTRSGIMKVSAIIAGKSTVTLYDTRNGNVPVTATISYSKANLPMLLTGTQTNGDKFSIKFNGKGQPLSMTVTSTTGVVTKFTSTGTGWKNNATGTITAYKLANNSFAAAAQQIGYISHVNVPGTVLSNQAQMNTPFSAVLVWLYDQVQGTLGKLIGISGFLIGAFLLIGGYPKFAVASAFTVGVFMAFGPSVLNLIFGSAM